MHFFMAFKHKSVSLCEKRPSSLFYFRKTFVKTSRSDFAACYNVIKGHMPYTGAAEPPPGDVPTHGIPAELTSLLAGAKHITCSDQSEQTGLWEVG